MSAPSSVARLVPGGLAVAVRVTPRSSRDAIEGIETRGDRSAMKVRVCAQPADGKANAAVTMLIADFLGIPKRSVTVTAGHAARDKSITISGDAVAIQRTLSEKLKELAP